MLYYDSIEVSKWAELTEQMHQKTVILPPLVLFR